MTGPVRQRRRHRLVDPASGGAGELVVPTLTHPVEEQGGGEDRGQRVGDAAAGDVGRGAVRGLEESVLVPDVAGRREPEAADGARAEVGEDVAEHVLRHGTSNVAGRVTRYSAAAST